MDRRSNELLSDPMIQQIKALSRIDKTTTNTTSTSTLLSSENNLYERSKTTQTKFQSLLLPEEWLELSDTYLTLPPTLSDQSFISILKVIIYFFVSLF